jgi:signal transduction histidine kinase
METNERNILDGVLLIMKDLNFLIILYLACSMSLCLQGYIREQTARDFIMSVPYIPMKPQLIPVIAVMLYVSLLMLMHLKRAGGYLAIKIAVEIVLAIWICIILGFGYTGIVLLIAVDTMSYFTNEKGRNVFAILICGIYLLVDYDLISTRIPLISLSEYLNYYEPGVRSAILAIKNIMSSVNTFLFLVYMIFQVRVQMSENEKIISLNTRLNKSNEELKQANVQLEMYMNESVENARTKERNRLAREIHDTLGHTLTGIMAGIEACIAIIDISPEVAKQQLSSIEDVAREGMTDVRRSVKALRPDALERLDLKQAIEQVIDEMRTTARIDIDYECSTKLSGFNEDEEEVIYRIIQECITNSIRHGKATQITIRIDREYKLLKIYIHDNGIGCADIKKGFGLHHMKERLEMLGGTLDYNGEGGFTVNAQIPIRWGTEENND